jgi:hypothetical protein
MRNLIVLFFAMAATCAAQTLPTVPVIVKKIVLQNQTELEGSQASPVEIYTPKKDGFYRMTMYIVGTPNTELCGVYKPGQNTLCAVTGSDGNFADESVVVAFAVRAGQPIGFFTDTFPAGGTFTGSYDVFIVLELLC